MNVFIFSREISCIVSPVGKFANGGLHDCPKGTYQDEAGKVICKNCVRGRFNNQTGQSSFSSCSLCVAGTYQDESGQISCKDCEAGRYNNETG